MAEQLEGDEPPLPDDDDAVLSHYPGEHHEPPFPTVELIEFGRAATSRRLPIVLPDGFEASSNRQ